MAEEIERIRVIGESITTRRTVYFEISPAPHMFSFGTGTFLHEMIELVGAINIFGDQEGWIGVADEVLLGLNPDVIITSVNFIDDPIDEIINRPGWSNITAVANGDIFLVDTDSSNRPSQNIIYALREIAIAIYPDKFQ
jgi:iron complex transport system substrate-binding protein